jgi:thiol-disulfide isomerase/thioredoxin
MKKIIALLTIISFTSCQEKEKITTLSGFITGTDAKEIELEGINFSKKIPLQSNGAFSDTLDLPYEGMYYLLLTDEKSYFVYLEQGFNLQIETEADDFINAMKFNGTGKEENNYMIQKNKVIESKFGNPSNFKDVLTAYAVDEKTFIQTIEDLKIRLLNKLESSKIKNQKFVTNEKKEIDFFGLNCFEKYAPYHGYATANNEFKTSDSFPKVADDFDMNDEETFKHSYAYRGLIGAVFERFIYNTPAEGQTSFDRGMEKLQTVKSKMIRSELTKNMLDELNLAAKDIDKVYKGIIANSTDSTFNQKVTQKYETLKKISKGAASPTFDYENVTGGKTSLESLKGKFVYFDVWATWCGPCIAEIPALKEVEKEYHGKNIEFVSISIDERKDFEKWKKMVADKELKGIQLIADNAWESEFVKKYAIDGIPRFILIDTEGKIVSADAPRPSDLKLKELLTEVGL